MSPDFHVLVEELEEMEREEEEARLRREREAGSQTLEVHGEEEEQQEEISEEEKFRQLKKKVTQSNGKELTRKF